MSNSEIQIGCFFHASLSELHDIADKSGNPDCVLAMLALRRGQGAKSKTIWGRIALKKHMGLPHSRAENALRWLEENKFLKTEKGKSEQSSVRALTTVDDRIYLPNSLIDKVIKSAPGGPLAILMSEIRTGISCNISTVQARLDALFLLLALYGEHQNGTAKRDLIWWHWDTITAKGKSKFVACDGGNTLCLLSAVQGEMQFDVNAIKIALGKTYNHPQVATRVVLAVDNLKALNLAHSLKTVSRRTEIGSNGTPDKWELSYVLGSDTSSASTVLHEQLLKEAIAKLSLHLNEQSRDQSSAEILLSRIRAGSPIKIQYVGFKHHLYRLRSTFEPVDLPKNEDLIDIEENLKRNCDDWQNLINAAFVYNFETLNSAA